MHPRYVITSLTTLGPPSRVFEVYSAIFGTIIYAFTYVHARNAYKIIITQEKFKRGSMGSRKSTDNFAFIK